MRTEAGTGGIPGGESFSWPGARNRKLSIGTLTEDTRDELGELWR